jgi:argininosuccinate synthase
VRLYKGNCDVVGVRSEGSLVDREVATYGEQAKAWDGRDAKGFARILGVPSFLAARRDARTRMAEGEKSG